MRYCVQLDAEEAGVILDILYRHPGITQWMRSLQIIARVSHFGYQTTDPGIELQFEMTPVFGGANVLALDQLEIMGNTRQQEDIR